MAASEQVITDNYALYLGDAAEVMPALPEASVHLSCYSPPFGGALYQYSSDPADLSNVKDYKEFFEHYGFIVREVHRLTVPGRMTAVHCQDIMAPCGEVSCLIDFPGDVIRCHEANGWRYVARYHVWKEPLLVRNRTMVKSLHHKTMTEDSTRCSIAHADSLLVFRRSGRNPVPVAHPRGLTAYAGSRRPPDGVLRWQGYKGNQIKNEYSQWVWRQYACYSSDTEVLTRAGWKLHQEVSLDDEVCCFNPGTDAQEWHHPSHVHAFPFKGDMVNISGGTKSPLDLLVTPNHRMVVRPGYPLPVGSRKPHKNPRHWAFREAGTLSTSKWLVPYAVGEDRTGDGGSVPFARFLGWWISEGSLADDGPVLTQNIGRTAERMCETVEEIGYDANCVIQDGSARGRQPCMHLRLRGAIDLGRWLRGQCGGKTRVKHIPECAFSWSPEVRRALLEALIDGDGSRHTEDRFGYHTTSSRLADDVQRLAIGLGHSGRIARCAGAGERRAPWKYCVHIGCRKYVTIQPRNFSGVPYSGMVYCLTVPTGAYVTRRNGRMAVAGNSAFWDDVRVDRVLPHRESKDEQDEKHVHPLQLDVIERAVALWSNPGEVVLSPFAGVGSEVYGAVLNGRKGIGIELKGSYFRQAVRNLRSAAGQAPAGGPRERDLFSGAEAEADVSAGER